MAKEKKEAGFASKLGSIGSFFSSAYSSFDSVIGVTEKIEMCRQHCKQKISEALYKFKRNVMRSVVELVLLVSGIICLIIGLIMLVGRVVDIEYVLIAYGLLVTIFVMFFAKLKA